jgi:hypothetical protein
MALIVDKPQPILLLVLDAATITAIAHASQTLLKSLTDYVEAPPRAPRSHGENRSSITGR